MEVMNPKITINSQEDYLYWCYLYEPS
jgi:hypothetical protein